MLAFLLFSSVVHADNYGWELDVHETWFSLSQHGEVIWGDTIWLVFNKSDCSKAELGVNISSYAKNVMAYEGQKLLLELQGQEVQGRVGFVSEVGSKGLKIASVAMGLYKIDALKKWPDVTGSISVRISKKNTPDVLKQFDVRENYFSLFGLSEELRALTKYCSIKS
ncbi:hypothetical protein [Terasakiella sp.]|uniref:hypothetical protein n=1 Tax=Terasakiella sp. TaxID=2034861 RepID=UPI003AA8E61D